MAHTIMWFFTCRQVLPSSSTIRVVLGYMRSSRATRLTMSHCSAGSVLSRSATSSTQKCWRDRASTEDQLKAALLDQRVVAGTWQHLCLRGVVSRASVAAAIGGNARD